MSKKIYFTVAVLVLMALALFMYFKTVREEVKNEVLDTITEKNQTNENETDLSKKSTFLIENKVYTGYNDKIRIQVKSLVGNETDYTLWIEDKSENRGKGFLKSTFETVGGVMYLVFEIPKSTPRQVAVHQGVASKNPFEITPGVYNIFLSSKEEDSNKVELVVTDTTSWKTYKNEEYGFEFKYPAKFKDQYIESNVSLPDCRTNDDIVLLNELGSLQVNIACESDLIRSNAFKGRSQKTIVSGRNAFLFDYVSSTGYINREMYITLFDGVYINIMHTYKSGGNEYDELSLVDFNKIVSTFKFIDSSSSNISSWVTFKDEIYGYVVQYPNQYHVANEHNLVNYDENSPQYEKGNPNGVKIQFYRGDAFSLDLTKSYDREELFKSYYGSDAPIAGLSTKVEQITPIGEFTYRNSILSGPGGAFDVYYAFAKDGKSYYTATIWHINNDAKTVMNILSTFRPIVIPDYKVFGSDVNKFEIRYPKNFTFSESNDAGYNNELNLYHVSFNPSPNYQKGTDFGNAFVDVSISPKIENCKKQSPQGSTFTGSKKIGDTTFYFDPKQPTFDAAMGGERGFSSLFATVYNGQCYRIQKLVSYRDLHGFVDEPYNYPPHFDEKKVNADMDAIISSFTFTK